MNTLDKAKGLASVIKESAVRAVKGEAVLAPEAMINNRLAICKQCKYHGRIFCQACGCITEAKVRLAASHCPEGKWRSL